MLVFVWNARSGPHNAHLPTQNVQELRQFIQTSRTQERAQWDQPRIAFGINLRHGLFRVNQLFEIVFVNVAVCAGFHGSEFQTGETPPVVAHALLAEKNRSLG